MSDSLKIKKPDPLRQTQIVTREQNKFSDYDEIRERDPYTAAYFHLFVHLQQSGSVDDFMFNDLDEMIINDQGRLIYEG